MINPRSDNCAYYTDGQSDKETKDEQVIIRREADARASWVREVHGAKNWILDYGLFDLRIYLLMQRV